MLYHLDVIRNYYWLHAIVIVIIIVIVIVVIIVVGIVCINIKVKRTEVKQFVWIKYICFNKVHNNSILALYKEDKQKKQNETKQDKAENTTYVPEETFRVDFCKVGSSMYEVRCCFRVWCWWEEEGGRIEPSIDVAAAPRRPGYVEFVLDVDELLLLFDHENIVSILKLFGIVVCVRCKYHETYCNIQWNGNQKKSWNLT